jgi:heme oxygenase (mycobilin-producing)
MSVLVTVELQAESGAFDELVQLLEPEVSFASSAGGCEMADLYVDPGTSRVLLVERWTTPEAHRAFLEAWRERGFPQRLMDLLAAPPTSSTWSEPDR